MRDQARGILLFALLAGLLVLGGCYAWIMIVRPRDYLARPFENPATARAIRRLAQRGAIQIQGGQVICNEAQMSPAFYQQVQEYLRQGSVRAVDKRLFITPHLTRRTSAQGGQLSRDLLLPGRILDRYGTVLAWSEVQDGGLQRRYREAQDPLARELDGLMAGPLCAPLDNRDYLARRLTLTLAEGRPVTTTLDAALQEAALQAFANQPGAAVVLDCHSFEILAAVSSAADLPETPGPLGRAGGTWGTGSLPPNRALNRLYPPGSTFKVIVAAAALEGGLAQPGQSLAAGREYSPSPGSRILEHEALDRPTWPGYNPEGCASFDITQAFIVSSNVVFARLGSERVGWDALGACAGRFGYGQPLQIDLGEGAKPWKTATPVLASPRAGATLAAFQRSRKPLALVSIGQGENRVSVLEMALVAATVANGGVRHPPRLVLTAGRQGSSTPEQPEVRVISSQTAQRLQGWMRDVVESTSGTANRLWRPGISLAGKTGTALEDPDAKSHSWFIGFHPAYRPRIAFAVLVEHGGFGAEAAGDITLQIIQAWMKKPQRILSAESRQSLSP